MSEFNFKSSVCTSREQSERLLALGLKKETADMQYHAPHPMPYTIGHKCVGFPAWSLGRLIEMLPSPIKISELDLPTFHHYAYLDLSQVSVAYTWEDYDYCDRQLAGFYGNGFFAAVVDAVEWLIKEGYFNKEYLDGLACD